MSKPFNYPCYQFLFPHMDLEARTYLAQQSSLLRRVNRQTPIKFTKIQIFPDEIQFDDTTYSLYRKDNIPKRPHQHSYYFHFTISNPNRQTSQLAEVILPEKNLRDAQAYMLRKILCQDNIEIGTVSIHTSDKQDFDLILTTLSNLNLRIGSLEMNSLFSLRIPLNVGKLVLPNNSWSLLDNLYHEQHSRIHFHLAPLDDHLLRHHHLLISHLMITVRMFQQEPRNTPIHVSREIDNYLVAVGVMKRVSERPNARIMQRLTYQNHEGPGLVVLPKSDVFNVSVQLEIVTVEEKEVFVIHLRL